jgi:exodeoxyribonuclease V alpha subunit
MEKPHLPGGAEFLELAPVDMLFARFIGELSGKPAPGILEAAALASARARAGDLCVPLSRFAGARLALGEGGVWICPPYREWLGLLETSPAVGAPGDFTPLVLDSGRLYLHRHHAHETCLVREIQARAAMAPDVDDGLLQDGLERLFPRPARSEADWQRVAAAAAVLRGFAVITGGPGTGKTTTVARILALLAAQAKARRAPFRAALAAPTGKAAARLTEAVLGAFASMETSGAVSPETAASIPREASTLHRLLGARPGGRFARGSGSPLLLDAVVVDECSMVDAALLVRLFRALLPDTRVILLGDKDQLSSVSPGSVLGDLCAGAPLNRFSPDFARRLSMVSGEERFPVVDHAPPLLDSVVELTRSHRFSGEGGIGRLARAIVTGDTDMALETLRQGAGGVVFTPRAPGPGADLESLIGPAAVEGYSPCLSAAGPEEALERLDGFRVLCAARDGRAGYVAANMAAARALARAGKIALETGDWHHGRPVMVLSNDYSQGLFNGDTGLVWNTGRPRVCFPGQEGGTPREFSPFALPEHETAYAMTIHKSQGSEFRSVYVVLPGEDTPLLTRELLYTAVTRARETLHLIARPETVARAMERRAPRASGLEQALWGGFPEAAPR